MSAEPFSAVEVIIAKRERAELTDPQIDWVVDAYTRGVVADEQMSALAMAILLNGMTAREIARWTSAMIASGDRMDFTSLGRPTADKHSTGGVGDKITLPLAPLVAACGVAVPQLSGRGLGHTGGTLDKLESIPGWRAALSGPEMLAVLNDVGAVICAAGDGLAPADKKLYALRDVTGTVEAIPLIASSIMSKKIAEGTGALVLDVKVGCGAFMKTRGQAEELARLLIRLGNDAGVPTAALLSPMDEPLGRAVGNALEVEEAVQLLMTPDKAEPTFLAFCREIAVHGLLFTGKAKEAEASEMVETILASGQAARKFAEIVAAQGGPASCEAILAALPRAPLTRTVTADRAGVLTALDAEAIGSLAMAMGAGRHAKKDSIDPAVGIVLKQKVGASVEKGAVLAELHIRADDANREAEFQGALRAACRIEDKWDAVPARFWTAYLA